MKINAFPEEDQTNGWAKILPHRAPKPALEEHLTADWLVIGAGYAGLAAARRLAENRPEEKVVVLEAGESGMNASGRNSGFGIDLHPVHFCFWNKGHNFNRVQLNDRGAQ